MCVIHMLNLLATHFYYIYTELGNLFAVCLSLCLLLSVCASVCVPSSTLYREALDSKENAEVETVQYKMTLLQAITVSCEQCCLTAVGLVCRGRDRGYPICVVSYNKSDT